MAETIVRGALANLDFAAYAYPSDDGQAGVRMAERPYATRVSLRGDPADRGFMANAGRVLDLVLPTEAGATAAGGSVTALWLGPDEWLLLSAEGDSGLAERLDDALAGLAATAVEVTEGATMIRLAGPRARDVLAKGCPLDLHPRVFGAGRVAQSVIAQADAILHQTADDGGDGPAFEIHVRRSFAEYLWLWLADAAREYGVDVDR